jgi:hypothetical protein
MQTATYIDATVREAVRARSIAYIATDAAPGLTLAQHRRLRRPAGSAASRVDRVGRSRLRLTARYPDDPTGDYETTDGGW